MTVETPTSTANRHHPLSKIAIDSKYIAQPNDIQRFAKSFVPFIAGAVSGAKSTLFSENPSRMQKRLGHLFFDVEWDKYDLAVRPPYLVWTREAGFTSLNEFEFAKWRDALVEDEW